MLRIGHELLIQVPCVYAESFFCRCIHLKPAVVFIENNCPVLLVCLLLCYLRLFNESIWQAQSRIFRSLVWGVDRTNICPYLRADASNLWVFLCWKYILTQLAYSQAFQSYKFWYFEQYKQLQKISGQLLDYIQYPEFPKFCSDRPVACPGFRQILSPQGLVDFPRFCRITWNWVGLLLDVRPLGDNSYRAPGKFPT